MRRKTLAVTMMMVTAMSWNAATQAGVISRTYNISATGAGVGFDDPLNVSVGVTFDPTVTTDSWPCAPVDSINFGGSNYAQYDKGGYAFTYDVTSLIMTIGNWLYDSPPGTCYMSAGDLGRSRFSIDLNDLENPVLLDARWTVPDPADTSGQDIVTLFTTEGTVTVRSTVPEPASLALLGLGLAGIGYQRRKRVA